MQNFSNGSQQFITAHFLLNCLMLPVGATYFLITFIYLTADWAYLYPFLTCTNADLSPRENNKWIFLQSSMGLLLSTYSFLGAYFAYQEVKQEPLVRPNDQRYDSLVSVSPRIAFFNFLSNLVTLGIFISFHSLLTTKARNLSGVEYDAMECHIDSLNHAFLAGNANMVYTISAVLSWHKISEMRIIKYGRLFQQQLVVNVELPAVQPVAEARELDYRLLPGEPAIHP